MFNRHLTNRLAVGGKEKVAASPQGKDQEEPYGQAGAGKA